MTVSSAWAHRYSTQLQRLTAEAPRELGPAREPTINDRLGEFKPRPVSTL
jgi:hypothetical protein